MLNEFHIFDKSIPVALTDIADRMFLCMLCIIKFSTTFKSVTLNLNSVNDCNK